jgi:hypothetical protein
MLQRGRALLTRAAGAVLGCSASGTSVPATSAPHGPCGAALLLPSCCGAHYFAPTFPRTFAAVAMGGGTSSTSDAFLEVPGGKLPYTSRINFVGGDDSPAPTIPCYHTIDSTGQDVADAEVPYPLSQVRPTDLHHRHEATREGPLGLGGPYDRRRTVGRRAQTTGFRNLEDIDGSGRCRVWRGTGRSGAGERTAELTTWLHSRCVARAPPFHP